MAWTYRSSDHLDHAQVTQPHRSSWQQFLLSSVQQSLAGWGPVSCDRYRNKTKLKEIESNIQQSFVFCSLLTKSLFSAAPFQHYWFEPLASLTFTPINFPLVLFFTFSDTFQTTITCPHFSKSFVSAGQLIKWQQLTGRPPPCVNFNLLALGSCNLVLSVKCMRNGC